MSDPNRFGETYKNHRWERVVVDGGPATECRKCGLIWLPDMSSRQIRWCTK